MQKEPKQNFELIKDTSYLALTGELCGVYISEKCEFTN